MLSTDKGQSAPIIFQIILGTIEQNVTRVFFFCSNLQYQLANYSSDYGESGKGVLKLLLINQRQDFSFALFTGGLSDVSSSGH
jgi:hypothetical protein